MFEYEDSVLSCQGVSLEKLADEHDTPLYVYDGDYIEKQAARFTSSLPAKKGTICYAVKANTNLTLLKKLAALGIGADVVLQAFTLLFGGVCLAAALAFGLGGREKAARLIEGWTASAKRDEPQES